MPVRLLARRPSPTTVSFTVSNASSRASSTAKLLFVFRVALRTLLFFCVFLVGIAKLRHVPFVYDAYMTHLEAIWSDPWGSFLCRIVDSYSGWVIAGISASVMYGVFRRGYTEEALLVIRGLGIQTSTSSATYLSKAATRFIPATQIQDIVIHEAFKGFEVRFYLAVIVDGEPDVVVVFPTLLPGRAVLEEVWRGSRHCLYDAKS